MAIVLQISLRPAIPRTSSLHQTLQMEKLQEKLPELLVLPAVDDDIDTRVENKK